ncbi:phage holin family protein [Brachybacterium sp. JHP9]|uniref:Phage holin family protein n=1 Tax=Brachybacterium equifaecis TaxID=2910770 RepID=A0ABT0QXW5_9MICO|nr:phage holin family protein [Brachybacterium equifaecis]MCL6421849.1 phage holin family protein [Brachybacterium equifaecis]
MINTTNDPTTPPTQRSIGELVASIKDELLGVVHQEIDIAKKEITALGVKAGIVAACAAVLLFLLLSAWVMLLFAAAWGLVALGVPHWGAFLIIAGVFILLAAVAGLVAFLVARKLRAPETTIETAKGAVDAVQGKRRSNAVSYDDTFDELYGKQVSARVSDSGAYSSASAMAVPATGSPVRAASSITDVDSPHPGGSSAVR